MTESSARVGLITGGYGFVGRALCAELDRRHYDIRVVVRNNIHSVTGP